MRIRGLRRLGLLITVAFICVLTLLCGISLGAIYNITDFNNPHNLSAQGPGGFTFMTLQVCVFCHTPHGANTEVHESTFWNSTGYQNLSGNGSYLLWNRDIKNSPSYETYQSSTMQSDPQEVRIHSLLCLSCHDGVSAMNVMTNLPDENSWYWGTDPYAGPPAGGLTTIGGGVKMSDGLGSTNIGDRTAAADAANLSNDHPVSFDYDADLVGSDGELNPPGTIDPALRLFYSADTGQLTSLECSTCHEVHTYETGFRQPFLVMSNQNSAMCLSCHIK